MASDGSGVETLVLRWSPDGTTLATVYVTTEYCVGVARGQVHGDHGHLTMTTTDDGFQCRISIRLGPKGAAVTEELCADGHGARCNFTGDLPPAAPGAVVPEGEGHR